MKLSPIPLDLTANLELFQIPGLDISMSRLNFANRLSYTLDQPYISKTLSGNLPLIEDEDLMQNSSSVSGMLRWGKLVVHQEFKLNLAYLPELDYQQAAYQPLLDVLTYADYRLDSYLFKFQLLQHYFNKDHLGQHLPEAIICNVGAEYQKGEQSIYLMLSNLLGMKEYCFTGYPPTKLSLYLGLKYRF